VAAGATLSGTPVVRGHERFASMFDCAGKVRLWWNLGRVI
jgi:hypothetical protein